MDKFTSKARSASQMAARQCLNIVMEHNARLTDGDGFGREALEHTLEFVLLAANETEKLFSQKVSEIKKFLEKEEK